MMTVAETLRKSADLIESRGWCRYQTTNDEGNHCAVGAIISVVTGERRARWGNIAPSHEPITRPVIEALGRHVAEDELERHPYPTYHYGSKEAVRWNNHRAVNGDEVVNTMRAVAALHDQGSAPVEQEVLAHVGA